MPDASDYLLLTLAPALAKAQVVEFRIKLPTDGEWEIDLEELVPVLFQASGHTVEQIRDGLADQIIDPVYAGFSVKKIITDRFWLTGPKGDPFTYAFLTPGGAVDGVTAKKQSASGATTIMRLTYLALAAKLIKVDVWGDKTQEAQCWLAAFFCEKALLAEAALGALAGGGVASNMSLGGASIGLSGAAVQMPTDAELSGSIAYGSPLLILWKSVTYGPLWSM